MSGFIFGFFLFCEGLKLPPFSLLGAERKTSHGESTAEKCPPARKKKKKKKKGGGGGGKKIDVHFEGDYPEVSIFMVKSQALPPI